VKGAVQRFASELSRRRVVRVLVAYLVAVFGTLQGLDVMVTRLELPPVWMRWAVLLSLAGLPVAAVLAWVFDWTSEGVVRTAPVEGQPARAHPLVLAVVAGCVSLTVLVAVLAWRQARELAAPADPVSGTLDELLRKFHADAHPLPPWFVASVHRHVDRLIADPRTRAVVYPRMKQYWPMLSSKLAAHGLPEELGYVAWAESELDPSARNDPCCAGLWQFRAATAREYGLRVDAKSDERLDPDRSTEAAGRYLANLFAEFGSDSFMLAVAAYNRGEGPLRRTLFELAQKPGGLRPEDRNFWHLYRLRALPQETMEYVPLVLAIAVICHDPRRYGLE
jgi:soluble lytic murein transglycosylase-like protein